MVPKTKRWIVFRPNVRPLASIPLNVRSVGRYAVPSEWRESPREKWFTELVWMIEGRMEFRFGKQWKVAGAGDLFFYRPGDVHENRAKTFVRYCWVTFDHADSWQWIESFGLGSPLHSEGTCPESRFLRIGRMLNEGTEEGERNAAHLAHALLLSASASTSNPQSNSLVVQARNLLDERFTNPHTAIGDIVADLGVHRTTLFRSFRLHYGLTPSVYLQNLRRQRALSLLRDTQLPIQEVARQSGFADPNYFSRTVREIAGMSPSEFRVS